MAEITQVRWSERLNLDYDDLSGRYLFYGALLAFTRVFWAIGRTSGLFGTPPDAQHKTFEDLLYYLMVAYTVAGFVALISIVISRMRSEENLTSSRVIINWAGVVIFLLFANRVGAVAESEPHAFTSYWCTQLTNGLVLGGVYALIALGYTLVYGILFMINFAHGEVLVMGAFGGYFALVYVTDLGNGVFEPGAATVSSVMLPLLVALMFLPLNIIFKSGRQRAAESDATQRLMTYFSIPFRFILGALVGYGLLLALGGYAPNIYEVLITVLAMIFIIGAGVLTSMLTAIAVERIAYRPLRHAPRLTPLISAIGASFFLQQSMLNIFGPGFKYYVAPKLLSTAVTINLGSLGSFNVPKTGILIVVVSILLMIGLYLFVQRSKTGRAMRSVAEDKNTAALMGVNIDRVIVVTFALGAALAGAAGVMVGFYNTGVNFRSGFLPGIKAFTAAVLGGIGNIPGAMFGGFFLGMVEALGPGLLGIPTEYKDVLAFSLLVLVLIFRPTGLFGEVLSEKKV